MCVCELLLMNVLFHYLMLGPIVIMDLMQIKVTQVLLLAQLYHLIGPGVSKI